MVISLAEFVYNRAHMQQQLAKPTLEIDLSHVFLSVCLSRSHTFKVNVVTIY